VTETAPPAKGRSKGRARSLLLALLTSLLLVLGFTLVSSLSAGVSENRYWMLGCGLFVCVALPAILASWIRGIRRRGARSDVTRGDATRGDTDQGPGRPGPGRPGPRSVSAIAATNLILILGGTVLAPTATGAGVRRHGAWWVESIAKLVGRDRQSPVVRGAERACGWVADLLGSKAEAPARGGAATAGAATEGGAKGDGAPTVGDAGAPGAVATPDSGPDTAPRTPAAPGEVRVRFERRGTAVIVPATIHGPSGHADVKMLFDTGATLTTLDAATLRRIGVSISPQDPTIETHTAAGNVRRSITVIEGVTLGAARISGGVTVSNCEPCRRGEVVGLLGLNVLRHFKVTLDDEAGQVVLHPRTTGDPSGDLKDIEPFLDLERPAGVWRGPMLTVTATLHNRSPRRLRYVKIAAVVRKGDKVGRVWGELRDVPARGRAYVQLEGLSPVKGARFQLKFERAHW